MLATVVVFALALTASAGAQTPYPQVTTQPSLYPAFQQAVSDYVVRCTDATPVSITVTAPAGTEVNVDGQGPRGGTFTTSVRLRSGQGFGIAVTSGATGQGHYVRCLPSDFPRTTFQRFGQPQAEWYTVAPIGRTDFQPVPPGISTAYVALFDGNGVPVWWTDTVYGLTDFHPISNGNVVWIGGGVDERRLDGSLVRQLAPVGADIDSHETLLLPNGNYLITTARLMPGLTQCGQVRDSALDNGAQEVTPDGSVVWSWWASDHIPGSDVPTAWCEGTDPRGRYDPFHINSVEPDGDGFIMSFRHLDAIYRVSKADGRVVWKLGGTTRPESLTVLNDPVASVGGPLWAQHDARVLSDGTVTVHDNGFHSLSQRTPRAVRYAIDANAKTARLVEQKEEPGIVIGCCGSARRLPGGNWLIAWGSSGVITELSPSGSRVFKLTFDDNLFAYRSHPVPYGTFSRTALRAGMDAQFPRGYARPISAGLGQPMKVPLVPASKECVAPNRMHGPPLASPSCSSPTLASSVLTVGTKDSNGAATNSSGFVSYRVLMGNPLTPVSEADVTLRVSLTDVRWKSGLSDYGGQLQLRGAVRITDRLNGSLQNEAATGLDTEFPVLIQCGATASTTVGGNCSLASSLNAIVPGTVVEGKRAIWQLGQVQVYDGGPSGYAGGFGATLFQTQGLFVP